MALLGKSFDDYVDKQVKIRQKSLGGPSLTPETLKIYNNQSPWIRLASSVDITAGDTSLPGKSVLEQVKGLFNGFEYVGDKLAKNFVLFGGVNTEKGGVENMPTGINKTPLKSAYGFGYKNLNRDNSRGYVPMPGIESVDFSYKNDGALAQASIQIKCFSPEQFQMIDILFQRPGYTVLLEFGHSVFKDNEGNIQYAGQGDYSYETEPFSNLYNPKEDQGFYNLLDLIQDEKAKWDGNYEAFYAKITKFNWKFNSDGSYNITVNLIGLGDVISSLKMDVTPPKINFSNSGGVEGVEGTIDLNTIKGIYEKDESIFQPSTFIEFNGVAAKYRKKTSGERSIQKDERYYKDGDYIYYNDDKGINSKYYKIPISEFNKSSFTLSESSTIQNSLTSAFTYELRRVKEEMGEKIKKGGNKDDTISSYTSVTPYPYTVGDTIVKGLKVTIPKGVLGILTDNKDHDPGTYISFGVLLSIIQQYCNQYSKGIPLLQFGFKFIKMDEDNNYIKTYSGLFSSDPTKVLIPYYQLPTNIIGGSNPLTRPSKNKKQGKPFNDPSVLKSSPFFVSGDTNKGRLAYVFLHTDYLSTKFVESLGSDNTGLKVLDFLKDVLKDIDDNLNNLNNFKILHNKETNKIEIVSETPIEETTPNPTIINTFGVTKTEGSFIKDMSLDSELSDNYATQISVGAQNNGLNSQSNSLSFSTYNKGLIDRMIPEKNDDGSIKSTPSSKSKKEKRDKAAEYYMSLERNEDGSVTTVSDLWGRIWTPKTSEVFKSVYVNYNIDSETLSSLKSLNSSISKFISGELTKKSLAPPPIFLPFNLKLTMDGLSGMRIYDSFEIDGKVLPASYNPEQIQLTIKSLSHKVDTNGWTTQVETFCQPKFEYDYTKIKVGEVPTVSSATGLPPVLGPGTEQVAFNSPPFTPSKDKGIISFDPTAAFNLYKSRGNKTSFEESLKKVLSYMQSDSNLKSIDHVAYLLATAKGESDYSLERWEADYACGKRGISYKTLPGGKPCKKALNYYRSTEGDKANYYKNGIDKNGLPYFGRGLIQLTNKYNYKKYGDIIGVDLVNNADLAMVDINSYKIASAYMVTKPVFPYVDKGDLRTARKRVNGRTKGLDKINKAFFEWRTILSDPSVNFKVQKSPTSKN